MQEDNKEKNVVIQAGGLSKDTSLVNQPPGTTTFALNAVNESQEGDLGFKSTENSNETCYELPEGYHPLGKVYIGDGETLHFLTHPGGDSMLLVTDKNCNIRVEVDDSNQVEKLGFKISHQIDATYRLRRGCEKTIYWVDPKPRIYILGKEEKFKNSTGDWDISKFNLFKTYSKIPIFEDIEQTQGNGNLLPGSYNFSIQYLDEDLNPTEFVTSTETVAVYNSSFNLPFRDVRGSTGKEESYQNFGRTDKAIKITLSNLDTDFPFYRLAITEATSGLGQISDTKYTAEISTQNNIFTYTGTNYESIGSQKEIVMFNNIIDSGESIEQIENTLVIGKVKGKQIDFCKLQKYASRINADMVTKPVLLNELVEGNSKFPTAHIDGMGYMPGEIYSFGIVYIFEDNSLSPVYHIPGKNPTVNPTTMYSLGTNVYPMDNINNQSEDNEYIDNNSCGAEGYWGSDSTGLVLKDTKVRHHRFPLRTDYNIPLVEKVSSTVVSTLFKRIKINANGIIQIPVNCLPVGDPGYDPACVPNVAPPFEIKISYTEDGVPNSFSVFLDPSNWIGGPTPQAIVYNAISNILSGTNIVITEIKEDGVIVPGTWTAGVYTSTGASGKGLMYNINVADSLNEFTEEAYVGYAFGIRFSNVELPSETETGGNKIIGYYIVRNERVEDEKTILDSAVLTSTVKNANFVSSGLLMPQFVDDTLIKKDIVSMINPEFKFNDKKYTNFNKILHQGRFTKTETIYSRTKINDIMDGTGYVDGKHKDGESDEDGWSIQIKTRDNFTTFSNRKDFELTTNDIKETFYLDALADKLILDSNDQGADVFNLACDNKVGIISLKDDITFPIVNAVPYVYLVKDNANPYSNFRLTPYYKESKNPHYFTSSTSTTDIFNGDSYITPLRYVNSIFYDNRVKQRAGKTSAWNYIIAAVLVIVAVVVAIFTWGAGTAGSIALIGLAAGLVGGAALLVSSGIKQDAWNRAYNQLYNQGLRETIADDYVRYDTDPISGQQRGFVKNPEDDEVQWLGDCLNLWFESAVNMNLRHGNTDNTPDFLNAPGKIEVGTAYPEWDREYFGIYSVGSSAISPTTALDNHMVKKLTYLDYDRKGGRMYVGLALAEVYMLNPDYTRRNKQKIFNHLGLEYDCCSDCLEDFPNRFHWSEQSFQEELTDNFRIFLPNNYKDLEGNTGSITDMFRIQNNLYIHTEEALWHLPQNIKERVTGDIISFLGTGEYFSIPPRKIVDDTSSSAGNLHKWARLKTKYGVLFPSHTEKKWYLFNGESLTPISDMGLSSEFRQAMKFYIEEQFQALNSTGYPYANNPSNDIGTGYISTYDSTKERFIITKKDFILEDGALDSDTQICDEGYGTIVFNDFSHTIAEQALLGYTYLGIENCKLKFSKTTYVDQTITQQIITTIPNDTEVYAFYDTSGSFLAPQLAQIRASVIAWYSAFRPADTSFSGLHHINDSTERWLNYPSAIPSGGNVLVLTFVNEANDIYHGGGLENPLAGPTAAYIADFNNFVTNIFPNFTNFVGINYPIVTGNVAGGTGLCFLQHSLAAIKGRNYTLVEVNELPVNSAYSPVVWSTVKASLLVNPYSTVLDGAGDPGLEKYNWRVKSDKNDLGTLATPECPASTDIISPCQFAQDINAILADYTTIEEVEVVISVPTTEYIYIEGVGVPFDRFTSGWTMSYSLKDKQWVSWHSYLPSFYFNIEGEHYSWIPESNFYWKHNKPHHYLTYYGVKYPFIIEYVDAKNPLVTQITDGLMFQTEAKKFDEDLGEYYDIPDVTFDKIVAYNTHQITGLLDIVVKNNSNANYLIQQIVNANNYITADRNERDWTLNTLRSIRINNAQPMFIKSIPLLQNEYFIDKIVNPLAVNYNKHWSELESLRDKFLVVRLIFDTFDDTKLIMNFAIDDKKVSER